MTSEMGELFNAIKEERRQKRRNNYERYLATFKEEGWGEYTEHHWFKTIILEGKETIVQFWPSSNKYCIGKKYYRGSLPKDLRELIHRGI